MGKKTIIAVMTLAGFAAGAAHGLEIDVPGGRLACDFVAEGVVRVQYALGTKLADNATGVTVPQKPLAFKVETEEREGEIRMTGGGLVVTIDRRTGRVSYRDAKSGGTILSERASSPHEGEAVATERVVYDEKSARVVHTENGDVTVRDEIGRESGAASGRYRVRFDWRDGESLYGLGSRIDGWLDLRGKEVFLTQHNMEAMVPLLVSTEGYALLFDAGSAMRFSDKDGEGLFEIEAAKELDYYFMRGENMDEAIARYRTLTGESPMMPRYFFGYVQSKERYHSSEEILNTLKRYRELGVPIDLIVQDWNYWPQGWGYMKMDRKHYPDPAALAKGVHDMNARLMVSIWPNPQNCPEERDFRERGLMLPNNIYNAFSPEGRDLYWKYADEEFFSNGFDAWWCDSSEPIDSDWKHMPDGYGPFSAKERWLLSNEGLSATLGAERAVLFSLYHARGIYEHQRAATDEKRVVNLTRSSFAGQQRYATVTWNGDTSADWDSFRRQIPSGLGFMAAGCPYWSVDVGAFFVYGNDGLWFMHGKFPGGVKNEGYREYYVRMMEWAAYLPLMRSHGTHTPREIWQFGERGTPWFDALEKTIRARYELLPYIYSLAARVTREGYTMTRLLAFDFPSDKRARNTGDEFMFGPALLVAPVTAPKVASREVYLPLFEAGGRPGSWYDIRTGARYEAGTTVDAAAPLDSIPVFQRGGSIAVRGPVVQYADAQRGLPLTVTVAPGADAEFELYDDEGDGYRYEKGAFDTVRLEWRDGTKEFVAHDRRGAAPGMPARQEITVRVIGAGEKAFTYDGRRASVSFAEPAEKGDRR